MLQNNLIPDFYNPMLIRIVLETSYNGRWSALNTKRSLAQGLRAYQRDYGYIPPDRSFLVTIPHQAYAMAAAAVSPLLTNSGKETHTAYFRLNTG
jgi:hypothetical protein